MTEAEFKERTKQVGLRVIRVVEALPRNRAADVIGRQVLRSGTAIGANYRAACRAQSTRDMLAKLADVEEEADETLYWLEMLVDARIMPATKLAALNAEVEAVLKMVIASIRTLRRSLPQSKTRNPKSKME